MGVNSGDNLSSLESQSALLAYWLPNASGRTVSYLCFTVISLSTLQPQTPKMHTTGVSRFRSMT